MTTLLLRLSGPMQAWGESSRFARRGTEKAPTKSGVIGLLAAARGLRRTDPLEELLSLRFGVRVDQPGRVERDFHTTRTADGTRSFPLTERFYLTDATFVAAVEGEQGLIDALDDALRHPAFPLYLGRRSCPPVGPVTLGTRDASLWAALHAEPWQAAPWWRRKQDARVDVEVLVDAAAVPPEEQAHTATEHHDEPVSFDPRLREYGWRSVSRTHVAVVNDQPRPPRAASHDPFAALGGA
ncbi:type I-E CRISPR-associated protein Cas5/CasD [Xylanimonas protaetiae]|uniref:Type I-E CRISPR-associated protein Cas5/CasD n=1 Tax=Xylanimonas protaetiae TaxID=2509457 RepID=A0A4V0YGJ1_9MICO|nr:type I-E CRISPR-associated protein Cas5/CasD [Xylanimonas protaetiae]QAY71391.1 type I-E CRISPR-associated protein Cas5/CasD [Xylanimonas protaetiae]